MALSIKANEVTFNKLPTKTTPVEQSLIELQVEFEFNKRIFTGQGTSSFAAFAAKESESLHHFEILEHSIPIFLESWGTSPFTFWLQAYNKLHQWGRAKEHTPYLIEAFSALYERCLIDAYCRARNSAIFPLFEKMHSASNSANCDPSSARVK